MTDYPAGWPLSRPRTRRVDHRPNSRRRPGPKPTPEAERRFHAICPACNLRMMARDAASCFSCAPKSPEMLELDRALANGRTSPRASLADLERL